MVADGYVSACERSLCLRTYGWLVLSGGAASTTLPSDWVATLGVYEAGRRLEPVPAWDATLQVDGDWYYELERTIAFPPVDVAADARSLLLHYARVPSRPATWGDALDPGFPKEYHYLLRHYAAWRIYMNQGGAQDMPKATFERNMFELGVQQLAREADPGRVPPRRVQHLVEVAW